MNVHSNEKVLRPHSIEAQIVGGVKDSVGELGSLVDLALKDFGRLLQEIEPILASNIPTNETKEIKGVSPPSCELAAQVLMVKESVDLLVTKINGTLARIRL